MERGQRAAAAAPPPSPVYADSAGGAGLETDPQLCTATVTVVPTSIGSDTMTEGQ